MESRKVVLMNLAEDGLVGIVGEGEGGTDWESSIDMYTLLYVKEIISGKLLYSTGIPVGALRWPGGVWWVQGREA